MSMIRATSGVASANASFGAIKSVPGFLAAIALVGALGLMALGTLAARSAEPLLLTILAFFAAIGVFFIFGLLAGQFRLTARATEADAALAVAENLHEAVQVTRLDGRVAFANTAMLALYPDAAGHRTVEQIFAGEPQGEEAVFRLLRAAERGEAHVEEFEVRRMPGGTAPGWVSVMVAPVDAGLGGEPARRHLLWRVADVTDAHRREAENRRIGESVLAGYDGLPAGLLFAGDDGRVVHANQTLLNWLGVEPQGGQALDLKFSDILTAESAALLALHRTEGGAAERFDLDFVGAGGRRFPAALVGVAARDGGWSAVVLHRSLAPSRDAALSDVAAKRLFHAAPIGIATVDRDGNVVSANGALARMLLLGSIRERTPLVELLSGELPEDARSAVQTALAAALAGRAQVPIAEISVGAKREFTRRVYMSPLPDGKGPEAVILYMVDATEQKSLEEQYAQSQKMEAVGKLAGGIAHDFNNVLTAIIGWSDLLLGTQRPGDPAFQNVMNIKSSANRAAGLVNQLLAFSRRQTLMPETLQLGEVLTDLSVLLNRLLGEKIDLKIHQGRDLWHVKADRTQFCQVVINLAVNARDAMPDGGKLSIRTRNVTERESRKLESQGAPITGGEYVLVEVEDTGVGMPAHVLAKIFEPFFTTKGVGKGTGLGLSTVHGIVHQTGGYVLADSVPGQGTTFRVYLPRHVVEVEDEAVAVKPSRKAPAKDLTGRGRVLLVEDEDAVRSFALEALRRQGYEVFEAASGVEALELMDKIDGKVDIVVSDVIMPEMDGPSMLRELRKRDPDIKIVFVSGYPDDAFKNNLEPDAKFAFLPKPFSLAQLAAKVKDELSA